MTVQTRREFIAASCVTALMPGLAASPSRRLRLGFQVYGVRELCAKDLVGTLKAAKEIGYEGVETGRFYGRGAAEWKSLCGDLGLDLLALQVYPHNLTEPQLGETIHFCHTAGCSRVNVAWYRGSEENANDWQLLINVLNHAAEVCAKEGIAVGYHNHDHEFRQRIGDRCVWDWLWREGDGTDLRQISATPRFSPRVTQELDCGHCVLGGGNPVEWIGRFSGRIPCVHLTPAIVDATGLKPGEAGIGSSRDTADWPSVLTALRRCGTEWLTVKLTQFPDSLADLKASFGYLKGIV